MCRLLFCTLFSDVKKGQAAAAPVPLLVCTDTAKYSTPLKQFFPISTLIHRPKANICFLIPISSVFCILYPQYLELST